MPKTKRVKFSNIDDILRVLNGKIIDFKVNKKKIHLTKLIDGELSSMIIQWGGSYSLQYSLYQKCKCSDDINIFYQLLLRELVKVAIERELILE